MESDRRAGWRKGIVGERREVTLEGGRVGRGGPQTTFGGGGWKALRVPSKFGTKGGDSSGFERLPKAGEPVRERVSRIVHWIS